MAEVERLDNPGLSLESEAECNISMSANGTKRTFIETQSMSALRGRADSPICSQRSASDP
jgi:hypothetical protein